MILAPEAGDLMPLALGNIQKNVRPRLYDTTTGFYKLSGVDYGGIGNSFQSPVNNNPGTAAAFDGRMR